MHIQDVRSGVFSPLDHQSRLATITREGWGYQRVPNAKEVCRAGSIFGSCELLWKISSESVNYNEPILEAVEKRSRTEMELGTRDSCEASEEDVLLT